MGARAENMPWVPGQPVIGLSCSFLGAGLEMAGTCSQSGCKFLDFPEGNVNRNWKHRMEIS